MEGFRDYVISVIASALICSIITRITQNSGCREAVRVLCGVFLTIVLLQPISGLREMELSAYFDSWEQQAQVVADNGTAAAKDMKAAIIKQEMEAYIINKAAEENAVVEAEVTLGDDFLPASVQLTGVVSPSVKQKLTQLLTAELGIPGEYQKWNG